VRSRSTLWLVAAALMAAVLGLVASVAMHGTASLKASPLGQWALETFGAEDGTLRVGDAVAPFELPTLDGGHTTLPVAGKATLINYWASWCGPCREELPLLLDLARRRGDGLALAAVALDTPAEARAFAAQAGLPANVPLETPGPADSSVRLGNRAGVLPFSVLVGADGRLQAVRVGAFKSAADLDGWLAAAESRR
jgi:thiol-disulfide isomerase/thioredoxin